MTVKDNDIKVVRDAASGYVMVPSLSHAVSVLERNFESLTPPRAEFQHSGSSGRHSDSCIRCCCYT